MKKSLIAKICTVVVILGIAACMFIIGRGHTVYFDAKAIEYNGETLTPGYRTAIFVNGERVARLSDGDRGMATWIGQNFKCTVEVTPEKGAEAVSHELTVKLPYNMDGIVLNMPALLAGAPESVYLSEFVSMAVESSPAEEEIVTDEFTLGDI
ncbi:MAG: hypothetical protein IJI45_07265 [Anaerolineaceae bacterium]|nr:hypothetical protein [Anaerolineaceae bacterium]